MKTPAFRAAILLRFALLLLAWMTTASGAGAAEGGSLRLPWNSSKVSGSPEPPPPYIAERAFPNLQFAEPIEFVAVPSSGLIAVAELKGKIWTFSTSDAGSRRELLVDLKAARPDLSNLYGLAFHPGFATNREIFICYVLKDEDPNGTRVSRFKVSALNPPRIDVASEEVLLTFLGGGHNGGSIHFGNDGYLYISSGDGRGPDPPDTLNTGQDISDLLSSILRIDVNHKQPGLAYAVPSDNPFVSTPGARGEVWAYGLRNPWRMSFDRDTGDLWVGDVGWELWEMVYLVKKGANYGWSVVEGKQSIKPGGKLGPTPITPPTAIHPHSEAASITGGYVYRGTKLPALRGAYIYADWETGKIWALRQKTGEASLPQELTDTAFKIVAFGEDVDRELYFLDMQGGTIQRLVANPDSGKVSSFPRRLSETGIFSSLQNGTPSSGLAKFEPASPLWRDGASASRAFGIPAKGNIKVANGAWTYPKDSVWTKTYSLEVADKNHQWVPKKIETQILHFNGESWGAYSYRWNDSQDDAMLVEKNGAEQVFRIRDTEILGGESDLTWRFQSRAECLRCHNPWCGTLLGFNPAQLKNTGVLDRLAAEGWFDGTPDTNPQVKLVNPASDQVSSELAARSYLHANCSHCHREHAGGSVMVFMNLEIPMDKAGLINAKPSQGTFGLPEARVIAPGAPTSSVLLYRLSKLGKGHMPYLGSTRIDPTGIRVLRNWILSLPGTAPAVSSGHGDLIARLAAGSPGNPRESDAILDKLLSAPDSAFALVHALPQLPTTIANSAKSRGIASSNPLVHDLFERFQPEEKRAKTLGADFQPDQVLGLPGNADRGRILFFQEGGAQCATCHRIGSEGKSFGPELTHVGTKYTAEKVLEQIRLPSLIIDPAFAGQTVETRKGESISGILISRNEQAVVLRLVSGEEMTIPRKEIVRIDTQKLSLMPEGLMQSMTAQQAADLVEFLSTLK